MVNGELNNRGISIKDRGNVGDLNYNNEGYKYIRLLLYKKKGLLSIIVIFRITTKLFVVA